MRIGLTSSHFLHQKHFDIINKKKRRTFQFRVSYNQMYVLF